MSKDLKDAKLEEVSGGDEGRMGNFAYKATGEGDFHVFDRTTGKTLTRVKDSRMAYQVLCNKNGVAPYSDEAASLVAQSHI